MKKLLYFIFIFFYFNIYSQKTLEEIEISENRKKTICLVSASFLPYFVSYQTFHTTPNQRDDYFYGGVWVSMGICLDIGAVSYIFKNKKLKQKQKMYEN